MALFATANLDTKQLARLSKTAQNPSGNLVELSLPDSHPVAGDRNPFQNWKLNDAGDDLELLLSTVPDQKNNFDKRLETVFWISSTVLKHLLVDLSGTHTQQQVLGLLQSFTEQYTVERIEYALTGNPKILTAFAAPDPVHDFWLDLEIKSGLTYRNFMINSLTAWQSIILL